LRTVEATRDSARAALLNAQAVINAERAWLIAEPVENAGKPNFYEIRIKNSGQTPARFIRGDATYLFIEQPDKLPVPPQYKSPILVPQQLLIASNKGFPIPHGYDVDHLRARSEATGKTFVIYGRIVYNDTITPAIEHETRWCFGYLPDANEVNAGGRFVLTGPSEYTDNT